MTIGDQAEQDKSYLRVFVGSFAKLGIGEQWMQHAEVCVSELEKQSEKRPCRHRLELTASLSSGRSTSSRMNTSTKTRRSFVKKYSWVPGVVKSR